MSHERERLAADASAFTVEQWATPSQCSPWTVEETLAHLTAAASIGRWGWFRSVLGARFDFELHNRRRLQEYTGATPTETLERFTAAVDKRIGPTEDTWAWLGEVIVHATDIRAPLGITTAPDLTTTVHLAEYFAGKDFTVPSRTTAADLQLVATDSDFHHGKGPEVAGSTLDLVMVMAGRPYHLRQLRGPGVPTLEERLRL